MSSSFNDFITNSIQVDEENNTVTVEAKVDISKYISDAMLVNTTESSTKSEDRCSATASSTLSTLSPVVHQHITLNTMTGEVISVAASISFHDHFMYNPGMSLLSMNSYGSALVLGWENPHFTPRQREFLDEWYTLSSHATEVEAKEIMEELGFRNTQEIRDWFTHKVNRGEPGGPGLHKMWIINKQGRPTVPMVLDIVETKKRQAEANRQKSPPRNRTCACCGKVCRNEQLLKTHLQQHSIPVLEKGYEMKKKPRVSFRQTTVEFCAGTEKHYPI